MANKVRVKVSNRTPSIVPTSISTDEDVWRARSDARALRDIAEITSDPARLQNARKVLREDMNAVQSVLNGEPLTAQSTRRGGENPATRGNLDVQY